MTPLVLSYALYAAAIGLVVIGAVGMAVSRHGFRVVLALVIAESGANLLLVLAGFRWDALAPILDGAAGPMVDPVPQAMVLTAIVIGVGVQALALSLLIRVYRAYGTLDMAEIRRRMRADINHAAGLGPETGGDAPEGERPLVRSSASGLAPAQRSTQRPTQRPTQRGDA